MKPLEKSSYAFPYSLCKILKTATWSITIYSVAPAIAQDVDTTASHTHGWAETVAYESTVSRTPFWFHANQWGTVPTTGQVASLRGGVVGRQPFSKQTLSKPKWTYVYGLELVGNASKNSKLLLPQIYGGVAYKGIQLTVGRMKQHVGFNDHELGTGSYMWSGNALPIPKIQIGFENYTTLLKNLLYFKGFYSDGCFENNRPVTSDLKLHNKALYVRLGRLYGKVKLHGGFNHAVQWGGKSPYLTENGQMPTGINSYWYVVSGFKPKGKSNLSNFDETNRIGNHVASLDAGLELDLEHVNILFYRQNVVEDGSLFYLNNIKDGLNGVVFKFKKGTSADFSISKLTFELLYTKSEGGSVVTNQSGIRGKDDYFNNAQVRDGWSYYGRGIGTPFITAASENNWPRYADFFTNNNRVWVVHTGAKGVWTGINWTTKLSLSSNQGTYDQPFSSKVYQFSGLLAVAKQTSLLGGSTLQAALSVDQGKLLSNAAGLRLSVRKDLNF